MNKNKFYVTTPIYYPSGNLHIGHCYTTVIADALARYKRLRGYEVYFLTGTDEHGEKIQTTAQAANKSEQQFVDEIVEGIKELWSTLHMTHDQFIRTTDQKHKDAVQKIFTRFLEQGDIYKGNYEGLYCTPCEAFWTESQLDENGCCPDCHRPVQLKKEEAYFFKMSKYADRLVEYYESHPDFIEPVARKTEMMNTFIKPGLEDLCVSRTTFDWGIKVKEDPSHVVYVWIDALSNYITALGYQSEDETLFNKFWQPDTEILQLIGKEIVRFHTIYWPIMLMALDLPLPDKIYAHGWLVMKDGKMSKSKGNVVKPEMLIEKYGLDALRFYLLREMTLGNDGVFTPEQFVLRLNTDLANGLGNLLNRTVSMVDKYFNGTLSLFNDQVTPFDQELEMFIDAQITEFEAQMDKYQTDKGIIACFEIINRLNKYIDETQPWVLAKDEALKPQLENVMLHLVNGLRQAGILLLPFLEKAPEAIFNSFNLTESQTTYASLRDHHLLTNITCTKQAPLFNRLEVEKEVAYIQEQMEK